MVVSFPEYRGDIGAPKSESPKELASLSMISARVSLAAKPEFFPSTAHCLPPHLVSLPHNEAPGAKNTTRGSSNNVRRSGWSRNIKFYPGTNEELEAKGPSRVGHSWAQLVSKMKSLLHLSRRGIFNSGAGRDPGVTGGTVGLPSTGKNGWKQLLMGGEGLRKCPPGAL